MAKRSGLVSLRTVIDEAMKAYGISPEEIKEAASKPKPLEPGDYMENGIIMCGICHEPKEIGANREDGTEIKFPVVHGHEIKNNAFESMRDECFRGYEGYSGATFSECDAPIKSIFETYCANFREFGASKGHGFLLYGDKGVGKTYLASCVCNMLIEGGWKCRLTSLRAALDERQQLIAELSKCDLVVIDDFGTERDTAYGIETVFDVINMLYSKRKPMILTTNMTKSQLSNPPRGLSRAMDRIKERCQAIEYEGMNRRQGVIV